MQKMRLRQARRHRKTLRAVQGKPEAILERRQEGRRRSRRRFTGGIRRREDAEEIKDHFAGAGKMVENASSIASVNLVRIMSGKKE